MPPLFMAIWGDGTRHRLCEQHGREAVMLQDRPYRLVPLPVTRPRVRWRKQQETLDL